MEADGFIICSEKKKNQTKRVSGLPNINEPLFSSFCLSHKPYIYNLGFHGS